MALTAEQQALDYNPELQDVSRQRKLADLLMAQGLQQPQGQMISGHYVAPSWTQMLNPMANIVAGQAIGERADTEQTDIARKLRELGGQEVQDIMETYKKDPNLALQKASIARSPQARALAAQLSKATIVEPTTLEREYKAATAQGYKGSINDFKNQMTEAQKESNRIDRARLNLSAREQAFNLGLPMGGGGGVAPQAAPQAPYRTINPGSPILAPGQQPFVSQPQGGMQQQAMPQQAPMQGQMPRFASKAEQDVWIAGQKKKGELQAEALNALPTAKLKVESALGAINNMIGDTKIDEKGNIVYGKTEPHPGFHGAVGISGIGTGFGASGFIPGTDVQDFKTEFNKVGGSAFLQAVETLRGTGAISEVEGKKATEAITSMSLAQSEKAFVKAANEFRDAVNKGYSASQQKAGVMPFNPAAQPSVGNVSKPKYVYNPATGTLE